MSGDQLEEYRRLMQERHRRGAEGVGNVEREEQIQRDEELARKLGQDSQVSDYGTASRETAEVPIRTYNQGYNPEQPVVYPGYAQSSYPPPSPSPARFYQANPYPATTGLRETQPLVSSQNDGFLPEVKDTCCYINTQVCVLALAITMILGIITGIAIVAST